MLALGTDFEGEKSNALYSRQLAHARTEGLPNAYWLRRNAASTKCVACPPWLWDAPPFCFSHAPMDIKPLLTRSSPGLPA